MNPYIEEETPPIDSMQGELWGWGFWLIVLSVVHIAASSYLDPTWGVLIIGLGTINLVFPFRGMFILNGLALVLVGLLNMAGGGAWFLFGILQICWGFKEIVRFGSYAAA